MVKVWNPVTDVYDDFPLDPFAVDSTVVHDAGDETIAGVKTFSSDPIIPDEVYGVGWNGSLEPPTKNAVYDKIETIGGGSVDDTAYDATSWNGVTGTAPSKNAVRDKVETLAPKDLSAVFASAETSLTNTQPNSLTTTAYVQWGSEEAVVAQADAPASAVVLAWLSGSIRPGTGTATADRGQARIEVSFNGGSTWATMVTSPAVTLASTTATKDTLIGCQGRAIDTVTGDIQVRAMCADRDTANHILFNQGVLTMMVHPQ